MCKNFHVYLQLLELEVSVTYEKKKINSILLHSVCPTSDKTTKKSILKKYCFKNNFISTGKIFFFKGGKPSISLQLAYNSTTVRDPRPDKMSEGAVFFY